MMGESQEAQRFESVSVAVVAICSAARSVLPACGFTRDEAALVVLRLHEDRVGAPKGRRVHRLLEQR